MYIHEHTSRLQGTIQDDNNILIDFTPKGGPANLLGKWDKDGIVFPVSLCVCCVCVCVCVLSCVCVCLCLCVRAHIFARCSLRSVYVIRTYIISCVCVCVLCGGTNSCSKHTRFISHCLQTRALSKYMCSHSIRTKFLAHGL